MAESLVETLKSCCNELLACSPATLRTLARSELERQHPACTTSDEPCDACGARLLVARMLHAVAQTSEGGGAVQLEPVKCSRCSSEADGRFRIDGRVACVDCFQVAAAQCDAAIAAWRREENTR